MVGKIIKGIAGFYYVNVENYGLVECKAKGIFRNQNQKPLVGDDVEIDLLDEAEHLGNITQIAPRKNELIRPTVANCDQAMVIFATCEPAPNLNLLDRFLIMMSKQQVETIICFNKTDLASEEKILSLQKIYADCGYQTIFISAQTKAGTEQLRLLTNGKTTVLAGPSGVGKSTIMNLMQPEANMETGVLSEKIKRGKHTTRHSELVFVGSGTYMMDTPGFSSLYITEIEKEDLKEYFYEFASLEKECRFSGCLHLEEPDCAVKAALSCDKLPRSRYENYVQMYRELKKQKKY